MEMIVSRMLMTMILPSVIVDSIAASKHSFDCYQCMNCKKVDKHTYKQHKCGACLKYVFDGPEKRIDRLCTESCTKVPPRSDAKIYCCKSKLCNSTSRINFSRTFIYSILFIVINAKLFGRFQ
uniref:UPAR/Ly6 domain-containing protein n=1 Tax=Trichobilharzia regenti TaxID=157069 RepID=A0AA85JYS1_TRIRE|nr:unnamed protein product [Trichobilharzia regenti]